MSEMKIPAKESIEAYISQSGNICLKQEHDSQVEDSIIVIDPQDAQTIIGWLTQLAGEYDI